MKPGSLTWASVGAAVISSLCCIGPLVAVAFGLGAFGAAAAFESLRPWFLGLTALFLAGAFYLTYRRRAQEDVCGTETCPPSLPSRHARLILWISAGAVAAIALFPDYRPHVWSMQAPDLATGEQREVELEVSGMT